MEKDINLGRVILGDYKIISVMHKFKTSTIYKAVNIETGESFSIKTINTANPKINDQFEISIDRQKELSHQNIVKTIEHHKAHSGKVFQITELINGVSLSEIIENVGKLNNEKEIFHLIDEVGSAIAYCHEKETVHGNLAPWNIFLIEEENKIHVKLLDITFNQVQSLMYWESVSGEQIDSSYQSPEARDFVTVSELSDLYSLALITYKIITGHLLEITGEEDEVIPSISSTGSKIKAAELLDRLFEKVLKQDDGNEPIDSIEKFQFELHKWYEATQKPVENKEEEDSAANDAQEEEEEDREKLKSELKQSVHDIVTLRRTQHSQEETIAMKLTDLAGSGARESPGKTLKKLFSTFALSIFLMGALIYSFIKFSAPIKQAWIEHQTRQIQEEAHKPEQDTNQIALENRLKQTQPSSNSPLMKSVKPEPVKALDPKNPYYFEELPAEKLIIKQPYHPPNNIKYSRFTNNLR